MSDDLSQTKDPVRAIITEARRIYEDAHYCYTGHSQEARWWARVSLWIGIPTAVVAAVTGLTSFSVQDSSPIVLGLQSNVVVGVLAFAVAAMSGLATFLDPKGQASKHEQNSVAYFGLCMDARMFHEIDCIRTDNVDELQDKLKKLSARLNELNSQTLIISGRAQRVIEKRKKSGKYDYDVDREQRKLSK